MLPEKSPMLQKATSALSCIFLGKINRDNPILQYGIGLYNEAICELSKTLSLSNYTPDLIYTCALFEQIEVLKITGSCSNNANLTDENSGPLLSGFAR